MAKKALEIYQGNDWTTYRWPVAQAFDTLDRIREVCRHPDMLEALPQLSGLPLPRIDLADDEMVDVYGCILELCDDLSAELDAVQADLFPYLQGDLAHRWMSFEMRLHLNEMRQEAFAEHQSPEPSGVAIDAIMALAARIRDLLKHIDQ